MTIRSKDETSAVIVRRIDAIITELQELREQVRTIQPTTEPSRDLVEEMAGSLGQGTWDEYDPQLDWKQFDT
jgi:hypothetical protein